MEEYREREDCVTSFVVSRLTGNGFGRGTDLEEIVTVRSTAAEGGREGRGERRTLVSKDLTARRLQRYK